MASNSFKINRKTVRSMAFLRTWALKQLDDHKCKCDNCRSAQATLESIMRDLILDHPDLSDGR